MIKTGIKEGERGGCYRESIPTMLLNFHRCGKQNSVYTLNRWVLWACLSAVFDCEVLISYECLLQITGPANDLRHV